MITPPTWNLPEPIDMRLGQSTYGRQRAIVEDGHLLLVLHQPPGADDRRRDGALFWRNPAGEWQSSRSGSGAGALKRHVQAYSEIESKFTQQYEKACDATAFFDLLESLTPMGRAAHNMHLAIQAARQAIPNDPSIIEARDLADEVDRNLELLLEDVGNAIRYRSAREAETQAKLSQEALQASHRLNTLAALFFPLTAITSLFGMNLANGISPGHPLIFWLVFILGVGLGFAIKSWVLAKPNPKGKEGGRPGLTGVRE